MKTFEGHWLLAFIAIVVFCFLKLWEIISVTWYWLLIPALWPVFFTIIYAVISMIESGLTGRSKDEL